MPTALRHGGRRRVSGAARGRVSEGGVSEAANALGLAKDLPAGEMGNLMLTNAQFTDKDLRQLPNRRRRAAKHSLVERGSRHRIRVGGGQEALRLCRRTQHLARRPLPCAVAGDPPPRARPVQRGRDARARAAAPDAHAQALRRVRGEPGAGEAVITNRSKADPGNLATPVMGSFGATGQARAVSAQAQLMKRTVRRLTMLVPVVFVIGYGTAAGGLVGAGIVRASGDAAAGAMIGASVGMMIDIMDWF